MSGIQLAALIPLFILLILSLIFRRCGILHLTTLGYSFLLGLFVIANAWGMLFFAPIAGAVVISLLLFIFAMVEGSWI